MGKSGSSSNDNNGEVHEQENGEESAEKVCVSYNYLYKSLALI